MSYIKINENDKKIILDDAENIPKTFIDPSDADITAADVAKDKIAYGAEGKVIGTAELVTEGWYYTQDADIEAEDVMSGKIGYGANGQIVGSYVPLDTSDADATSSDIASGKTAYVDGVKITGIANIEPTNWFYVENIDDHDITLRVENNRDAADDRLLTFWTSLDKGVWRYSGVIWPGVPFERTIPVGQKMFISGNGAQNGTANSALDGVHITADGLHNIGGDMSSMMQKYPESLNLSYLFRSDYNLVSAYDLILPWNVLSNECYYGMFYNCTSLTTAPRILPATSLTYNCYGSMFRECTALTTAPELPATKLKEHSYSSMFNGCTSLTTAPALPAFTAEYSSCAYMFQNCTSLMNVPPIKLIAYEVYGGQNACDYMFSGCTALTTAPELPGTLVPQYAYHNMFDGCSSLTTAPALPATTVGSWAYQGMFENCTALTTAPELPATTLDEGCYSNMFQYCTSLTTAPILHAEELRPYCYQYMFRGCSSLSNLRCLAQDITPDMCTYEWLGDVAATGTFDADSRFVSIWPTDDISGVPTGWTLNAYDICEGDAECHCELQAGDWDPDTQTCSINYFRVNNLTNTYGNVHFNLQNYEYGRPIKLMTSTDGVNWTTEEDLANLNGWQLPPNGTLYFYGPNNSEFSNETREINLRCNVDFSVSGSLKTLCKDLKSWAFRSLFNANAEPILATTLKTAENLVLPWLDLSSARYCYRYMFQGCTSLTTAPELPATTLSLACYAGMFYGCTSLTTAPELLVPNPVQDSYEFMFWECYRLNYVKCLMETRPEGYTITNYMIPQDTNGTLECAAGMYDWWNNLRGASTGPRDFTIVETT